MDTEVGTKRWRIVSFDGGGPGCYSQLLIMKEIMNRLKYDLGIRSGDIYPADYFEMMGGVGFGGFIATLLGCFRFTVKQAMDEFHLLASTLFAGTHIGAINPTFNAENLKKYVEGLLERRKLPIDVELDDEQLQISSCKVVLVATPSNNVSICQLFRNYFSRHSYEECTLVDALCATMSVPTFFAPAAVGLGMACQHFIGGGFSFNNPTRVILNEARTTFGNQGDLGLLLSLGPGRPELLSLDDSAPIAETMETLLTRFSRNSEIVARELSTQFGEGDEYVRLNVDQGMENALFSDWRILGRVKTHTQAYLQVDIPSRLLDRSVERLRGNFGHPSQRSVHLQSMALLETVSSNIESNKDDSILSELRPKNIEWDSPHIVCMEGTRLDILVEIDQLITNVDGPNIIWLKGHPGVGKSTIAVSLVSQLRKSNKLGSSFVFRRDKSAVMTTNTLWRMVAFDLARRYSSFRKVLIANLNSNDFSPTTLNVQNLFRYTIQEPLVGSGDIPIEKLPVIVIDALDECGGLEGAYSEDRKGLMQTIKAWARLPTRYKLVVTSRIEVDIEHTLNKVLHKSIEISVGQAVSTHSRHDIRVFFEYHFGKITQYNSGLPPQWPGSNIIEQLAEQAAGLFIWARTVVRLISCGEPTGQLRRVLQGNITGNISSLYSLILNTSFSKPTKEEINAFQIILGSIILARSPLSASTLHHLLSIEESMIAYIRNGLYSVLEAGDVLRIGHQSFTDFLINEDECPEAFHIQIEQQKEYLTAACLRTMQKELRFNICQIPSSYLRNLDIPMISSSIDRNISLHLRYSCWYWTDHLTSRRYNLNSCEGLRWLMKYQFLFWLEVMSLTGRTNRVPNMLSSLINWTECSHDAETARDMRRFVVTFGSAISQSIPHIYLSALPFMPQNSAISTLYTGLYSRTFKISSEGQKDWSAIRYTLSGLSKPASSLAFSSDGKYIASGHEDGTIRIWSVEMGEMITGPFEGHVSRIASIKFSPDGKLIFAGCLDGRVQVWSIEAGDVILTRSLKYNESFTSIKFSPDGKHVAFIPIIKGVSVWSAETGKPVLDLPLRHDGRILSVSFSPNGDRIASVNVGGTIKVWAIPSGEIVIGLLKGPLKRHRDEVCFVEFLPDGKRIASVSRDKAIRVWNVETGETILRSFPGYVHSIASALLSSSGRHLLFRSFDGKIWTCDVETGSIIGGPFEGHTDVVISMAISPDGKHIVSGSRDKVIWVWDARIRGGIERVTEMQDNSNAIAGLPSITDNSISRSDDTTTWLRNTGTGEEMAPTFEKHTDIEWSATFCPDYRHIVMVSSKGQARVWDGVADSPSIGSSARSYGQILYTTCSADSRLVASGHSQGMIRVWNTETGRAIRKLLEISEFTVWSLAFSADGGRLISGGTDGEVCIWNSETGKVITRPHTSHRESVWSVTFSPDGRHVASGTWKSEIQASNAETGEIIARISEESMRIVRALAFSPDGKRLASGHRFGLIRVWDAETGSPVARPLRRHEDHVTSLSFSADGKYIVSGSEDNTVLVWGAETGKVVSGPFIGHTNRILSVKFSPDGRYIYSASADKTMRVWDWGTPIQGPHSMLLSAINQASLEDGWVLGPNKELLLWVPPALRAGLLRPNCVSIIGDIVTTRLDFSSFVYGESWADLRYAYLLDLK